MARLPLIALLALLVVAAPARAGRTLVTDRAGGLHAFVVGSDGALYHAPPGATLTRVGGSFVQEPVAVARNADGRIAVFARGLDNTLQHAMFKGRYQSSDLVEMDYAAIARAMGCGGIRVEDPGKLGEALRTANADRGRPTVVDVVVTRDPGKMLPRVDNRTVEIKKGDRVA